MSYRLKERPSTNFIMIPERAPISFDQPSAAVLLCTSSNSRIEVATYISFRTDPPTSHYALRIEGIRKGIGRRRGFMTDLCVA